MPVQMQVRRGTAAAWSAANPTLASGEIGYETTTGFFKVGDGVTAWNTLAYATSGALPLRGQPGQDGEDGDPSWDYFGRGTIPPQREFLIAPAVLTADTANQASNVEAIVSPQLAVPAGFPKIGTTFELEFAFSAAQGAVAGNAATWRLRWGGLTGTILATITLAVNATLLAASPGWCRAAVTIRTLGATGTAKGYIRVSDPRPRIVAAATDTVYDAKSGGAVTINTTTANVLCVTCQNASADAAFLTFGESGFGQLVAY